VCGEAGSLLHERLCCCSGLHTHKQTCHTPHTHALQVGFCPVRSPFTSPACEGGCCISSGRCRKPLCAMNGLGADVIALDFICFGANKGPFGGVNKCKGLRCKLAVSFAAGGGVCQPWSLGVGASGAAAAPHPACCLNHAHTTDPTMHPQMPGCRSGPLGGNCVGYVAADAGTAINQHARQFIGRPCIEVMVGGWDRG
jgi:hypothetical protein